MRSKARAMTIDYANDCRDLLVTEMRTQAECARRTHLTRHRRAPSEQNSMNASFPCPSTADFADGERRRRVLTRRSIPENILHPAAIVTHIERRDVCSHPQSGVIMLYYALVFFIIAIIAAVFGFGGIAAGAAGIAKILFWGFIVVAVVTLVAGLVRR